MSIKYWMGVYTLLTPKEGGNGHLVAKEDSALVDQPWPLHPEIIHSCLYGAELLLDGSGRHAIVMDNLHIYDHLI